MRGYWPAEQPVGCCGYSWSTPLTLPALPGLTPPEVGKLGIPAWAVPTRPEMETPPLREGSQGAGFRARALSDS